VINYDYVDIDNLNGECYHSPDFEQYAINTNQNKFLNDLQMIKLLNKKKFF